MNDVKYTILYTLVANGVELTTANMKKAGLSSSDLTELYNRKIINRTSKGKYDFTAEYNLYIFALHQIETQDINQGIKALKKCVEMNPAYYQELLKNCLPSIINKNFDLTFRYLDAIYEINLANARFYLFLLNQITKVPERYKDKAKNLTFDGVIDSLEFSEPEHLEFKLRSLAFRKRFNQAVRVAENAKEIAKPNNTASLKIEIELLGLASRKQKEVQKVTLDLVRSHKYAELKKYLESRVKLGNPNEIEENALYVVQKMLALQEGLNTLKPKENETQNVFEAIKNDNFELALELMIDYYNRKNKSYKNDLLYLLLKDALELIKNLPYVATTNRAKEIVEDNLDRVLENGFIILEPMEPELMKEIQIFAYNSDILESFIIEDNDQARVVLKFTNPTNGIDCIQNFKEIDDLRSQGKSQEALELYKRILSQRQRNHIFYGKMGVTYIKIDDYENALNCFLIANHLAKTENPEANYTHYIDQLRAKIQEQKSVEKPFYNKPVETKPQN